MAQLPLDTSCEAVYEDGYIHSETDHQDVSPYTGQHNILNDIIEKRPEAEHGRMVAFSVYYKNEKYTIDWRLLPDNARPIRFRDGFITLQADDTQIQGWSGMRFGYQFTDDQGKHQQLVKEL